MVLYVQYHYRNESRLLTCHCRTYIRTPARYGTHLEHEASTAVQLSHNVSLLGSGQCHRTSSSTVCTATSSWLAMRRYLSCTMSSTSDRGSHSRRAQFKRGKEARLSSQRPCLSSERIAAETSLSAIPHLCPRAFLFQTMRALVRKTATAPLSKDELRSSIARATCCTRRRQGSGLRPEAE